MKFLLNLLILSLIFNVASCSPSEKFDNNEQDINNGNDNNEETLMKINLITERGVVTATLFDNPTAKALGNLLPMTVNMNELNGNEKYYYLHQDLPTAPRNPEVLHVGDVMLYGSDCLVVFYKTFSNSYKYTSLGKVEDSSNLEFILGPGAVNVTLELANE